MSDSDEILFDDIYELHEVIGKDFLLCTTMYFIKRYTAAEEVVASLCLLKRLLFISHFLANIIA